MHRLSKLIKSGVLSDGDRVDYVIPGVQGSGDFKYAAVLSADGRIIRPREVSAPTPPPSNAEFGQVEFQSPSSFVRNMLSFASTRLPKNRKARSVNGWDDCTVRGKKLNDLFRTLLRKNKKNTASISPSGASRESKSTTPSSAEKHKEQFEGRKSAEAAKADWRKSSGNVKADPKHDSVEKKQLKTSQAENANKKCKGDADDEKTSNKLDSSDKVKADSGHVEVSERDNKEKSKSVDSRRAEGKPKDDKKASATAEKNADPTGKSDEKMNASEDKPKLIEKLKSGKSSLAREPNKKSDGVDENEGHEKKKRNEKKSKESDRIASAQEGKNTTSIETKKSSSKRKEKKDKDGDEAMPDSPTEKPSKHKKESNNEVMDVSEEQEEGEVRSPPPTAQKTKDESSDDQLKKKTSKSQKRKRSITPQSDVERSTRAKSRRRILDPAAAEAAAVAAAADKQEGVSLRPTTRLTSGKIPKVVYNASPKTMPADPSESAAEEPQQPQRTSSRREKSKRSSRRRAKAASTEVSEEGGSSEREELETQTEERNQAIYLLTLLAIAVRRTNSITPSTIVTELRGKSINTEEAKGVLSDMLDNIRQVNSSVGLKSEGSDMRDQMLAYLGTEIARWNTEKSRPASIILRRKTRLETKRATVERLKRRGKKEHDEALSKLETEMDKRRAVDSDAGKLAIQVNVAKDELDRFRQSLNAVVKEVRQVKMQEQDGKKRVEKTKRLYAQLEQLAKTDTPIGVQNVGESVTSNDEDMGVAQTQTGSTPADPGRAAEVCRLRTLVRIREAEAEMLQRRCEMDSMKLRELQDMKLRLDNQLYRKRGRNVSKLLAAATSAKRKTDRAERNRQANGSSQVGNGRSRGGPTGVTKGSRKNSRREEKGKRKAGRPANS